MFSFQSIFSPSFFLILGIVFLTIGFLCRMYDIKLKEQNQRIQGMFELVNEVLQQFEILKIQVYQSRLSTGGQRNQHIINDEKEQFIHRSLDNNESQESQKEKESKSNHDSFSSSFMVNEINTSNKSKQIISTNNNNNNNNLNQTTKIIDLNKPYSSSLIVVSDDDDDESSNESETTYDEGEYEEIDQDDILESIDISHDFHEISKNIDISYIDYNNNSDDENKNDEDDDEDELKNENECKQEMQMLVFNELIESNENENTLQQLNELMMSHVMFPQKKDEQTNDEKDEKEEEENKPFFNADFFEIEEIDSHGVKYMKSFDDSNESISPSPFASFVISSGQVSMDAMFMAIASSASSSSSSTSQSSSSLPFVIDDKETTKQNDEIKSISIDLSSSSDTIKIGKKKTSSSSSPFASMSLTQLKQLVIEKQLCKNISKFKKQDLIDLLDASTD